MSASKILNRAWRTGRAMGRGLAIVGGGVVFGGIEFSAGVKDGFKEESVEYIEARKHRLENRQFVESLDESTERVESHTTERESHRVLEPVTA